MVTSVVPFRDRAVRYACGTTDVEVKALAFEYGGDKVGAGRFDVGERPVDEDRHESGRSGDLSAGFVHGVFAAERCLRGLCGRTEQGR